MIEELRELLKMVQGIPDMALHALIGFGIYKLIIFLGTSAGIYGTIRLAINKLYDYKKTSLETPKRQVVEHRLDYIITHDGTYNKLLDAIDSVRGVRSSRIINKKDFSKIGTKHEYIHAMDVDFLVESIQEKMKKEVELQQ